MVKDINDLDFSKTYTYADYLTWQFKERVELIKGRIFKMSPAPNLRHQTISREVFLGLGTFLRQKKCQVFHASFDVRLPRPKERKRKDKKDTVVQPDIVVVCDENKLDKQGCNGAPDLVIEILSPGNTKKEMKDKFFLYQQAGIKEYWIIEPLDNFVIAYTLDEKGKYIGSQPYTDEDILQSDILPDFKLDLSEVF